MLLIDAISSELIGAAVETTAWTSRQTDHGACPSDPWSGSLTSMIDAPPASAVRASSADRTLTSNCATLIGLRQPEGFRPARATPHAPAAGDGLARGSLPIQTGRRCPPGRPGSSGG